MRKLILGVVVFLILVVFMGIWFMKSQTSWLNKKMEITKICFKENCFLAQVAKTKSERTRGLMFRESLGNNEAMLFVFEQPNVHSFWMKNCKIALDIIWLDENYKVVAIKANNQPCPETGECPSINPNVVAKYVLEINAGLANKLGIEEGDYFGLIE